jgi:glycerol transport system permease protein
MPDANSPSTMKSPVRPESFDKLRTGSVEGQALARGHGRGVDKPVPSVVEGPSPNAMPSARNGNSWKPRLHTRTLFLWAYLVFALLPIYWMVNMSFKTNEEIVSSFSLLPQHFTWANYATIFTDPSWYSGYINSLIYVAINTVISITVALPAAYAFSRYSFLGDKHVFFWLLTNRMTPPAVFLLPFFQLYTTVGLMDTHIAVALAHLLFNVPLAVWILEGFMSGIPRELDETAYIDGYGFPRFFLTVFLPLIKAGVGVAAFFCFMFSWVELLLARTLTSVNAKPIVATMTRTVSASGMDWATLAAAGVLTIVPGAVVIWFVRHYIAKGFAMGRV